jgi:hypothetical protein
MTQKGFQRVCLFGFVRLKEVQQERSNHVSIPKAAGSAMGGVMVVPCVTRCSWTFEYTIL